VLGDISPSIYLEGTPYMSMKILVKNPRSMLFSAVGQHTHNLAPTLANLHITLSKFKESASAYTYIY
jgi:hypothetical protein